MPASTDLTLATIKVQGSGLSPDYYDSLLRISVESRLDMAPLAIIEFADPSLKLLEETTFDIGKPIVISLGKVGEAQRESTFDGEIIAIEPSMDATGSITLRVEATTRAHRMYSGAKSRSFVQQKDSDIFSKIANEYGLQADVDATNEVYEHVSQAGVTDWDFVRERARRIGYLVFVSGKKFYAKKLPYSEGAAVSLKYGRDLKEFRPRATAAAQPNEVSVGAWDPKQKREVLGRASGKNIAPSIGLQPNTFTSTFQRGESKLVRGVAMSMADANQMAAAARTELWSSSIQAEGLCEGNPGLMAGVKVSVSGVGTKFSGDYVLSQVRHVRDAGGYWTEFEVRGLRSESFADLVMGGAGEDGVGASSRWQGVVTGLVTNLNDPEGLGRVKVKFPWLASDYESGWARIAVPMAGDSRGVFYMPEVNDEVLVAFEHGDFNQPFVVGGLYNGKDKPPAGAVASGQVKQRTIVSKAGHKIILIEEGGKEAIHIIDKTGKNKILIDSTSGKITVEGTDLEITASKSIKMKAAQVDIEAQSNMNIKASAQLNMEGTATASLKGGIINLN